MRAKNNYASIENNNVRFKTFYKRQKTSKGGIKFMYRPYGSTYVLMFVCSLINQEQFDRF